MQRRVYNKHCYEKQKQKQNEALAPFSRRQEIAQWLYAAAHALHDSMQSR